MRFILDTKGVGELLKGSGVRRMISELTEKAASAARAMDPEATTTTERVTTDRAAGRVFVDPFDQAAKGTLTRGLASIGLEVKDRK